MFFATPAYAQDAAPAGGGIEVLMPFVLIFVVFYFFLIRPQQKKMKQHREMVSAIAIGDKVVTSGGILGRVVKIINEQEALVEIADNVQVSVLKSTISDVVTKKDSKDAKPQMATKPVEAPKKLTKKPTATKAKSSKSVKSAKK